MFHRGLIDSDGPAFKFIGLLLDSAFKPGPTMERNVSRNGIKLHQAKTCSAIVEYGRFFIGFVRIGYSMNCNFISKSIFKIAGIAGLARQGLMLFIYRRPPSSRPDIAQRRDGETKDTVIVFLYSILYDRRQMLVAYYIHLFEV